MMVKRCVSNSIAPNGTRLKDVFNLNNDIMTTEQNEIKSAEWRKKNLSKNSSLANVRARFTTQEVILFQLKDGKYQDAAGNEITTEMLMEYSHDIDGDEDILWL